MSAALLKSLFAAAVEAALPRCCVPGYLPDRPAGRTVVVGMGKAAAAMAQAVESVWGPQQGLVVTRYGHRVPTQIEVVEAGHPVPDPNGAAAAARMLSLVEPLTAADLALCLISGGGSALFTLPPNGIELSVLANINRQLLRSAAAIAEINTVRKSLSRSAGGRLAATAYPARVVSLVISDVAGDDLRAIASGPTVGDEVSPQRALEILDAYQISVPTAVKTYLTSGQNPVIQPGDRRLQTATAHLIATPQQSLAAAAQVAQAQGYTPYSLGDAVTGEAREVALAHARLVQQIQQRRGPVAPPCVVLSGGETTVTLNQFGGKGGRNSEFLLALLLALADSDQVDMNTIYALAADTDGIDGSEDNAGVALAPETLSQAHQQGLDPAGFLAQHDSYTFFSQLGGLVITGPTLTNVNDFRAIAIAA